MDMVRIELDAYECAIVGCLLREVVNHGVKPEWLDPEQKRLLNKIIDAIWEVEA